jgi:HEAT repeat protein
MMVPAVALLIPGTQWYLPGLLPSVKEHDGHAAGYWVNALDSRDGKVRHRAIFALGAIGQEASEGVPALSAILLDDPDRAIRSEVALALSKMDPASRAAVPALTVALEDEEPQVRMYAAVALFRLREEARPAVPTLIRGLKDELNWTLIEAFKLTVREMEAMTLGRASAGTADGVPALMEALESAKTDHTRRSAARALGAVGPEARPAASLLQKLLDSRDPNVRESAQEALVRIGLSAG